MKTQAEQVAYINQIGAIEDLSFTSIINAKQSIRTNSVYVLAATADGSVYQIAFSDHPSDVHHADLMDLDIDGLENFRGLKEFNDSILMSDPFAFTFFGFTKATKYDDETVAYLIDNDTYSRDRAYSMADYKAAKIISAELLNGGQVLRVSYNDADEYYINYTPAGTKEDAIAAQIAKQEGANAWEVDRFYVRNETDIKEEYDEIYGDDYDFDDLVQNDNEFVDGLENYLVFKQED